MDNRIEYNLTAYKKSIQEGKEKKLYCLWALIIDIQEILDIYLKNY